MSEPKHVPEPSYADEEAPGGITLTMLLRATESGNALSLFEEITEPNAGPPLHIHMEADEFFRVLAGRYRFQAGERVIDAGPGDTLFVPRGTPHCFCNVGDTRGRLFMGFTPAGSEALFDWIAENGMPSPEHATLIREKFDTEFVGPNPFVQPDA